MIDLVIDDLHGDPALLAAILTERSRFADRNGEPAAAHHDLAAARTTVSGVRDAGMQETLNASIDVADAVLRRRAEPRAAIVALDRAITFFAPGRLRHFLPDAYLQRARAYRALGDVTAAASDYAAALREVETQRSTIGDAELRLRFLDTAAQIIEESIDLDLSRGSVGDAFRVADRTRELLETSTAPLARVEVPPVASGIAVIEYAVLPHAVAIFSVSTSGIAVEKVDVERPALIQRIAVLAESIRRRAPLDQIDRQSAALYRLIVAPVEQRLASVDQLVIVPDRQLFAVPFAALYDDSRRQYLVERFTMRFAPALSATAETADRALQPALVAADPPTPYWPRLPASRDEGARIAAMQGATLLSGEAATRERFINAAAGSALIHYAGHADSDAGDSYGALLLAPTDRDSGILASGDIARLSLVRHPLVVLAACGTFRGDPIHAAGMSSLVRAFLLAGARAVVGTLWEVDDDISPLFLRFHQQLRAGVSPAHAVRAAQLEMIHASDARLRHPATWAPFEITEQSYRRIQ
jgi:CHAT domain-containing protein